MKKILFGAFVISAGFSATALANQMDDVLARLDAIEKENTAIRRENAALLANKKLREQNAKLRSTLPPAPAPETASSATRPPPASVEPPLAQRMVVLPDFDEAARDTFGAYAADFPVAYKAAPPTPGQLRIWGEGAAIWSGGDPVLQDFSIANFSNLISVFAGNGDIPGQFDLTPKIGWEAAAGFDYRFAGSPWHVSGQFRYGEGGKTSGSVGSAGSIDIATLIALFGGGSFLGATGGTFGGSQSFTASYRESHWLADFAVGRDVFTSGRDAMQVKAGIRFAEFTARTSTNDTFNEVFNFSPAIPSAIPGIPDISTASLTRQVLHDTRNSFLGAGPRVGIEGAIPFAGKWSLDYMGDAAILFGTQQSIFTSTDVVGFSPAVFSVLAGGVTSGNTITTTTTQRFASVFSGDIQVGIGYWVTDYMKLAASYRLDAMINVQNQSSPAVTNLTPNRYWHGPRLTLTGQFDPS